MSARVLSKNVPYLCSQVSAFKYVTILKCAAMRICLHAAKVNLIFKDMF
jgi:hypothetical protein